MREATYAAQQFEINLRLVGHLIDIRDDTNNPVSRDRRAALNQAALAFSITFWETYVEDVITDAAQTIGAHARDFWDLPQPVTNSLAARLKRTQSSLEHLILNEGWRGEVKDNAKKLVSDFNTPSAAHVNTLARDTIGLGRLSDRWRWQNWSATKSVDLLDSFIRSRHVIIHRGEKPDGLNKVWIPQLHRLLRGCIRATDEAVSEHVEEICRGEYTLLVATIDK